MKEYTIERYSFEELSDQAKEKAIEKARYDLHINMPEEFISMPLEEKLSELIPNADLELRYDLSYSQGSGLSFTGTITRENAPDFAWPDKAIRVNIGSSTHHYCHALTMTYEFLDEDYGEVNSDSEVFRDQILAICNQLEKLGRRLIELETSEESARAYLTDMEEVFLSDGTISIPRGEKVNA